MSELDHWQDRFTVAAQTLVEAFGDLRVRGYDKEPNLTAAALDDVESLVRELRAKGFGGEGDIKVGRAELIEAAHEYSGHVCTCDYCLHAGQPPADEAALGMTVDA
ncbi:hypothetical protein ACFWNG_03980 [Streptomyces sp. NPDC058391]|uniref:hypothetical protein n=1 Tax=Streptomyces sp. NPDC058391 TaxID=3346476 RepID=UPI00364CBFC2